MRRFLIDYARARPDAGFVPIQGLVGRTLHEKSKIEQATMIDSLMGGLAEVHPEWCSIVELKFFLGLTDEETAEVMGLSVRTIQRMWQDARRWLFEKLRPKCCRTAPNATRG